jgi:hypothetical protein
MLDAKVKDTARSTIQQQLDDRRERMRDEIQQIRRTMVARKLDGSKEMLGKVFELCVREIEMRAFMIWRVLYRAMVTAGVELDKLQMADLRAEVESHLPAPPADVAQHVLDAARACNVSPPPDLFGAHKDALQKVNAEIDQLFR